MSTASLPRTYPGHGDNAGLEIEGLSPEVERQIVRRLASGTFDAWSTAAARVGYCANPIRVRGTSISFDPQSSEVISQFTSATEPLGLLHLRCGNRRATACPSCSRLYAADTFHLIRCGLVGGKGVPETVSDNPLLFITLTAPSFGAVHGRRDGLRCHPRSGSAASCPHGRSLSCTVVHAEQDTRLGQPLCWECYDYEAHIVWQWWAPELWRRFTISLRRLLARNIGVRPTKLNDAATLQYAKVAEFQLRGAVHFHGLIRLDGPRSPEGFLPAPPELDADLLAELVEEAAAGVRLTAPAVLDSNQTPELGFGSQVDVRPVRSQRREDDSSQPLRPEQVAGYLAKYSTKSATEGPDGNGNDHLQRLRAVAAAIADSAARPEDDDLDWSDPYALMAKWVHMLGFRGHFSTKSRRYSVTLGSLRRARRRAQILIAEARSTGRRIDLTAIEDQLMADDEAETTLVIGDWRFAGSGWETAGDAALARAAAVRAREYAQWKAQQRTRTRRGKANVHAA